MPRKKNQNGMGRLGRDKKKKALETEKYKKDMESLTSRGIKAEDIQIIYDRCQERPQTKIAKDTLVTKLLALLEYFEERNKGIEEDAKGFISKDDCIKMIIKNPRIINSDIKNNIILKCEVITDKKDGNVKIANALIKSNPGVFRKTVKTIKEGR